MLHILCLVVWCVVRSSRGEPMTSGMTQHEKFPRSTLIKPANTLSSTSIPFPYMFVAWKISSVRHATGAAAHSGLKPGVTQTSWNIIENTVQILKKLTYLVLTTSKQSFRIIHLRLKCFVTKINCVMFVIMAPSVDVAHSLCKIFPSCI